MSGDNKLVWWKHVSSGGYTTNLSHAGVYSWEDAIFHCERVPEYTMYKVEDIDACAHRSVYGIKLEEDYDVG